MELLIPAGNFENLKTAISNGADSVYLGVKKFNARITASNFSIKELKEAIAYSHKRGVKVYVTLNTLIKNSEIKEFFNLLKEVYLAGADAVIIQHLSFASIIKNNFPDLKVHLSTQSRIQNLENINNVDRVILPRELSIDEIKNIKGSIEKEVFVQGALCFSVSGMCLMSSFIGGRSGNRGYCAQPCRKKYNDQYLMSMKDLSLLDRINELKKLNISALKVEGRLRNKKYIERITRTYRKALEGHKITEKDKDYIKAAFNRELTEGFFSQEKNKTNEQNLKFHDVKGYTPYNYKNDKKPIRINRESLKLQLPKTKPKPPSKEGFYVRVPNLKGVKESIRFNKVNTIFYQMDNSDVNEAKQIAKENKKQFYLILPSIVKNYEINDYIRKVKKINPDGVLVNALSFKDKFNNIIYDYGINVFNDYDLDFYGKSIISPELNFKELKNLKNKDFLVLIHGNLTVMTTKNPLPSKIKDEKGYTFSVVKEKDYYKVYNSKQIGLLDKIIQLKKEGITQYHLDLSNNVKKWLDIYTRILKGDKPNINKLRKGFTQGHFNRGVN